MARFKLFIEYEGTRYSGWQIQKNSRTVQGELIDAAKKIFKTDQVEIYGSGRTDAGVHALAQVAHLEVVTMLAPEIIRMKINDALPPDINLIEVEKAAPNFHARHDAVSRGYVYYISRRRTAFGKRFVWWVKEKLDAGAMRAAARVITGMNDFSSFTDDDPEEKSTRVLIEEVTVAEQGDLVVIRIRASHFIWKLVRRIVGVLAQAGRGAMSPADVEGLLAERSAEPAHFTAPPSGLFLERVYYQGDAFADELPSLLSVPHGRQ